MRQKTRHRLAWPRLIRYLRAVLAAEDARATVQADCQHVTAPFLLTIAKRPFVRRTHDIIRQLRIKSFESEDVFRLHYWQDLVFKFYSIMHFYMYKLLISMLSYSDSLSSSSFPSDTMLIAGPASPSCMCA